MIRRFLGAFLWVVVSVALIGCETLVELNDTKIGDVVRNPSQYDGKEVVTRGTVVDVVKAPFLDAKLYVLRDETGEILVVTTAGMPGMGSEVRVRGVVESAVIVGSQSYGLHLQESRRW